MSDWMSKLERAKALLEAGALTPEEFEAEKARLLPSSSPAHADQGDELIDAYGENEGTSHGGWVRAAIAIAFIAMSASIAFFAMMTPNATPASEAALSASSATSMRPQGAVQTPESLPAPAATPSKAEFACIGAFSNVSFSQESGDGSGLFIRIARTGQITWKYYEGSISRGEVKVIKLSTDRISAAVRYADYPNQPSSSVVLICKAGKLSVQSAHTGNLSLQRLTSKQAEELDL